MLDQRTLQIFEKAAQLLLAESGFNRDMNIPWGKIKCKKCKINFVVKNNKSGMCAVCFKESKYKRNNPQFVSIAKPKKT
jgi:hypothetical protein